MIVLAMGIHSLIAGISLGISNNSQQTTNLLIGMILHKWAEAFTISSSLIAAHIKTDKIKIIIFVLSIFTPLGVLVGSKLYSLGPLTSGIIMAVSSGTFLYISLGEIIHQEFSIGSWKGLKFIAFLLGILSFVLPTIFYKD